MTSVRLGSAGLNVTDLARSIDFYRRVLGFDVLRRSAPGDRPWAHLGARDVVLLTLWQQAWAGFAVDRAGLHHLSFEVADVAALRAVEEMIRAAGVPLRDGPATAGASTATGQLFLHDPDGIRLEVYAEVGPPVDWSLPPACGFFEES
ncbi:MULTISPECIES: VOC family protein [unclassified Micromonospora]|uniref:VOC family protein n=1 Tax=unclassified Micromonospora TaxID=2617518 RepID=UPI00098D2E42|nr:MULTISPECIES: VOC family protein [unclassified Micromonospora]MDI5936642.1 VOC family protein [Micromonospora sp. DH15]OON32478.1 hypothetical protein BSA16_05540 [Micromonospora sp. Rc5]